MSTLINCTFCGHRNLETDAQCSRCGSDFERHETADLTELAEELLEDDLSSNVTNVAVKAIEDDDDEDDDDAGDDGDRGAPADEPATRPGEQMLVCPGCAEKNRASNDYCQSCGAPLGVVTRVYKTGGDEGQDKVDWLVYGIETHTIGRAAEMERLEKAFRAVIDRSRASVCLLTGAPGLGKSRLVREFNANLDSLFPTALMVVGKCRDSDHLPYAPIARLVRKRFYIPELEIPRLARQRLESAVQSVMGSANATEIAHLVGYLIGLPFPESPFYADLEPDQTQDQRLEERAGLALARFLERDAQASPLILVIEEAHHATDETVSLLRLLASQLRSSPVMFLLVGAPELVDERPQLFAGDHLSEIIELAPLSDEDVRGLVGDILQRVEDLPESLLRIVCERAIGNPLMVEEIIKLLIGEDVIDTRAQPWVLHADRLEQVELPMEFEGLVRARIETLGPQERDCLEVASVLGRTFWLGAVLALMRGEPAPAAGAVANPLTIAASGEGGDDWQSARAARLADLLESLRRKDMIRPHADSLFKGEAEFVFKHGVERDLVYEGIPPERKQRLHMRAAQWYELHGRLDRFASTMAHHWELGGVPTQAAYRYVQAANLARARYLNTKAMAAYERAIDLLPPTDVLTRIEAHHNLGSTYELVGDVERALEQYQVLLELAFSLNAKAKGGMALNKIGRVHRSLGALNDALIHFRRALTLFQQANDLRGIASTLDDIGKVHFIRGEYDTAHKHYKAALELRRQLKDNRSIALSLHHLGNLELSQGHFDAALGAYRESLEMRKAAGDRQGVADTLCNLGIICMERGQSQQALRLWEEALTIAQDIGYRLMEGILLNNIGESALLMGALKTAESSLRDAAAIAQECGDLNLLCAIQRNLGSLYLKNAHFEDAVGAMTASLTIARDMESKLLEALTLRSLGELWAQTLFDESGDDEDPATPQERAHDCFRRAIELLREVGNEGELGRTLSAYGSYRLEQGEIEEGKALLEQAKDIFSRLDMRRVLEKTVQTIGEL